MTSKAVTQAGYRQQHVTNKNQATTQSGRFKTGFGDIMKESVEQSEKAVPQNKPPNKVEAVKPKQSKEVTSEVKSSDAPSKESIDGKEDMVQKVEKTVEEIVQKLGEQLGMTPEELTKVMELLGIGGIDLLQPNMLANLIAEVLGEEDMLAMVTNEELSEILTKAKQMVAETEGQLLKELDITPEEWNQFLEKWKAAQGVMEPGTKTKEGEPMDLTIPQGNSKEAPVLPTVQVGEENVDLFPKEEQHGSKDNGMLQQKDNNKTQADDSLFLAKTETGESDNTARLSQTNEQVIQPFQTFSEQISAKLDAVLQKNALPMDTPDTQQIMKQVTEYLKLTVRSDVTEMQMKLHPASLGTIDLSVAYKDGTLTAQFTAQNEAVKAALESQVVQLRENLSEQGLKVEAIEVTIASHEFERNLSQGNANGEETKQPKSGKRRIHLDAVNTQEEEFDEAERIAVELMKESGNTVDFTV